MIKFKNCENCSGIEALKPFVIKTQELFENEFSMEILNYEVLNISKSTEVNNINFVSSLSGALNANLIFSFEKSLAKKLLESFPYVEYTAEMEEEMIIETVAEFLNIVIGNAIKNITSHTSLAFSPPLALSGDSKFFCSKSFDVCKVVLKLKEGDLLIIFSTKVKR